MKYTTQPRWMDFAAVAVALGHALWALIVVVWPWVRAVMDSSALDGL